MKLNYKRKTILITGIIALALILILTILIAPMLKPADTPTEETLTIHDHGSAMVTVDDTVQQVTGKITVDSFGQITIKDDQSGEVYEILASQIIDQDQLVTFATTDPNGKVTEMIGEVVAQSENGTSTVLDPTTGTQYIVETTLLKKVNVEKTIATQSPTETTIVPTVETLAPTTNVTEQTPNPTQTAATKKTPSPTTTGPTTGTTTPVTTSQPVVADDITHESYTISTDPTLETAYIGPVASTPSEQSVNEAIVLDSNYIQEVLAEINRVRESNNISLLTLDSAGSDYSQSVLNYAKDLALGIADNAPAFPHVWTVTQSGNGAEAAQQLINMTSAVLDPSVSAVAICATQSSATGDIYLVIGF